MVIFVIIVLLPWSRNVIPGILDIVSESAPLSVPMHACRHQAAARAEQERQHQNDVREETDGVMPRHRRVKANCMVLCIEVAVVGRVELEGAAALRPVAVTLTLLESRDARKRKFDLVVEQSVVYVLIAINANNLTASLYRVREPVVVRQHHVEEAAQEEHHPNSKRHCPADCQAMRREGVHPEREVRHPAEEVIDHAPALPRVIVARLVVEGLLLSVHVLIGVAHRFQTKTLTTPRPPGAAAAMTQLRPQLPATVLSASKVHLLSTVLAPRAHPFVKNRNLSPKSILF